MGGRGQTKRLQSKVYEYLQENGPMTSTDICDWYNSDCYSNRFGYNYGTTPVSLGCVLRASVLFEKIGEEKKLESKDLFFRDLQECVWYAQTLHKQGNLVTAYCLPKYVNPGNVRIY